MEATTWPVDRYSDHFVNYLFDTYRGSRHVRRIATWIGFILKAIERAGGEISLSRTRQLQFTYGEDRFKVRYNHAVGQRGGIEIIEVLPLQGSPEGRTVATVTDLSKAEDLYLNLRNLLDSEG
jgi:hypothetical protein